MKFAQYNISTESIADMGEMGPMPNFWCYMRKTLLLLIGFIVLFCHTPGSVLGKMRPVLKQSRPLETPTWGPGGRRIILAEERSNRTVLVEWSIPDKRKRTVVSLQGVSSQPTYGPTGDSVYFFHRSDGTG